MNMINTIMGVIYFFGFVCLTILCGILLFFISRYLLSKIEVLTKRRKYFLVFIIIVVSLCAIIFTVAGEIVTAKLTLFG